MVYRCIHCGVGQSCAVNGCNIYPLPHAYHTKVYYFDAGGIMHSVQCMTVDSHQAVKLLVFSEQACVRSGVDQLHLWTQLCLLLLISAQHYFIRFFTFKLFGRKRIPGPVQCAHFTCWRAQVLVQMFHLQGLLTLFTESCLSLQASML